MRKKILLIATLFTMTLMGVPVSAEPSSAALKVIEQIDELKEMTFPEKEDIDAVQAAYDELSTGDKLEVTNYEDLEALVSSSDGDTAAEGDSEESFADKISKMEEQAPADEEQEETPAATEETGVAHKVEIKQDQGAVVIVHFLSSEDPELSIADPDGIATSLNSRIAKIQDESISATLRWESGFVEVSIQEAKPGTWTITSSTDATFEDKEYTGAKEDFSTKENEPATETEEAVADTGQNQSRQKALLKLIIPLAAIIAIPFILYAVLRAITKKKAKAAKTETKEKDPDPDMREEKVKEEIRREMMREFAAIEQAEEEPKPEVVEDETEPGGEMEESDFFEEFVEGYTSTLKEKENESEDRLVTKEEPDDEFPGGLLDGF